MKKLLTLLFAGCSLAATAQENPIEEFGYKRKIATLNGGKCVEYFDRDTIVQIGSLVYSTKSKRVARFNRPQGALA